MAVTQGRAPTREATLAVLTRHLQAFATSDVDAIL
jgi:hypothetical protein